MKRKYSFGKSLPTAIESAAICMPNTDSFDDVRHTYTAARPPSLGSVNACCLISTGYFAVEHEPRIPHINPMYTAKSRTPRLILAK